MDIPQPPRDEDLRNIIDRLAIFVAKNGPDFENITKQRQKENPRFQFMYGGEFFNYYSHRVATEQAILKHQANQANMRQQQMGGPPGHNIGMPQDFHGSQQIQPPQQAQFGQQHGPSRGMSPGFAGPRGHAPHMHQQQHNLQNRFGSPQQRQPFPGGGQGQGNMNMPPQNFQGPGQFGEYDQPGMGPGSGPRGPAPRAFQSRFQPAPQQPQRPLLQQGQSLMGNPNMQPQNLHPAVQAQFGQQRQPLPGQQQSQFGVGPQQLPALQQFGHQPGALQDQDMRGFGGGAPNAQLLQQNRFSAPQQQSLPPVPPTPTPVVQINVEALQVQKRALEDRVRESEQNLAAQQAVLSGQQKTRIEEALSQKHVNEISTLAAELNVDIAEFDRILEPIMESCTKESIANGKAWIFTHTSTKRHYQLLTLYLLQKTTTASMAFLQRLHIIYLVNDVLHHCMRKGAEDLQLALEAAVIPMFCFAKVVEAGNEENISKLDKLFGLWESKSNYVSKEAVTKLRNFDQTWIEYKNDLVARNAALVTQVAGEIQKTFEGYNAQHHIFAQHVAQNIKQIDEQIQRGVLQQAQAQIQQQQQAAALRNISEQQQAAMAAGHGQSGMVMQTGYPEQQNAGPTPDHGGRSVPDLSRPPPGFPPPNDKDLIPTLPYYELPAGLMVPLVKSEDDNYKPLDPNAIRLPPPCPPSEKLLLAVEAFYGPPSHDNPRDSEGWERLGLYEYYKAKNLARKQKEDDVREGRRQKSRSPTPVRRDSSPSGRSPPRRRYQSKSPSPSRRRRSRSRSPSPSRSSSSRRRRRSRSRSPRRNFRRSPTPPSFSTAGLGMEQRKLDESNKGHQLLKKMGWGGSGLGANEQGIEAPISGGDVRDKQDQYKGVGVSLHDPFESYRKNKAASFVERMRSREERP